MENELTTLNYRDKDSTLAVLTKRTYRVRRDGQTVVANEQVPLNKKPRWSEQGHLIDDLDVMISKPATDVVVKGSAYAPNGLPVKRLDASVSVGGFRKRVRVIGDRRCRWTMGSLRIDGPEPFTSMPLDYSRAYGGSDESARDELDTLRLGDLQRFVQHDLSHENPCVYKRNFVGKGFAIHEGESMDGLELPNIEDPDDLLRTRAIALRDPRFWYFQPIPAGFGWFDYRWFPRSAFLFLTSVLGPWESLPKKDDPPIREIRLGYLPGDIFTPKPLGECISERAMNGASPGLSLPYLKGDEEITLGNMDREAPLFRFQLPAEVPRIFVKPLCEEPRELKPTLNSVIIDKDRDLVSLVWGGSTQTTEPYGQDQLDRVAFKALWQQEV